MNNSDIEHSTNGIILMYHRVADVNLDPWCLSVSPNNFSEQVKVICKNFHPIPLSDLYQGNKGSKSPSPFVILTFDDGYADNYLYAAKILKQYAIPATFFLVSKSIGSKHGYWWDELQEILLTPGIINSPNKLQKKTEIPFDVWFGAETYTEMEYQRYSNWRWEDEDPTTRHKLFRKVYWWLRGLPEKERKKELKRLSHSVDNSPSDFLKNRILSRGEIRELATTELFEIGSHTVDHQDLLSLADKEKQKEIFGSKRSLENITGRPVLSFSYPYGTYNKESVSFVKQAGYFCACTVREGIIEFDESLYELPRIEIKNWNRTEFRSNISKYYDSL